jgi:drug/metabolite transporter (DMT)-like permease
MSAPHPRSGKPRASSREALLPWLLLGLAALFWSGNWVASRGIRETMPPFALTFWRWLPVVLVLAPVALPRLRGEGAILRRYWRILFLLGGFGVAIFTALVYLGLQTTTAVNAVLLNSAVPLFTLLISWLLERERATAGQIVGLVLSVFGILVIMRRGEFEHFFRFEFHRGDAFILAAMPCWGLYSVLLKRRPPSLDGVSLLFLMAAIGTALVAPFYLAETLFVRAPVVTAGGLATVVYIALVASVLAYVCWNRGVAAVGANRAGFMVHLVPAFGTLLAILFLGEEVRPYHFVGFSAILAGVWIATAPARRPVQGGASAAR